MQVHEVDEEAAFQVDCKQAGKVIRAHLAHEFLHVWGFGRVEGLENTFRDFDFEATLFFGEDKISPLF